jgi:hypothetical protein
LSSGFVYGKRKTPDRVNEAQKVFASERRTDE